MISNVRCGPALFLGTIDGAGGEDMAMKQDGVGSDLYIYMYVYIYIYASPDLNRLAPVSRRPGKIVVVDHLTTSGSNGNLSY